MSAAGGASNGTQGGAGDPGAEPGARPRVLFLDDDPVRAGQFLAEHPEAVWVQTAADCLGRLGEGWDEVHLDHDLGGERFVAWERDDCGMEVVRWLCQEPRPHLQATKFFIHTHNFQAACLMSTQMEFAGYQVEARPFGVSACPAPAELPASLLWRPPKRGRWFARLRQLLRRPRRPPTRPEPEAK